jgi:hypothetical protein
VDIRFLPPDTRRFDEAAVEVCACTIWSDERPMRGFAGLLDWRLGGRLSELLVSGFVRGDAGEALLIPGKPQVPFEKVLVVGLGERIAFGDDVFQAGVLRIASALEGLRVRRAVVELPGRGAGAIDAERAITLALASLGEGVEHDAWWLVEDAAGQRVIEPRVRTTRRTPSISDR